MERAELLERLIMGLEQQIPELQERMKYLEKDDLELGYTKKFILSMQENLEKSQKELKEIREKVKVEGKTD